MSDQDRLAEALSDRYRIERELGQGGMATVYLAEDLRHQRRVAVKVLRPDLSALLGGDRFLNEIRVTANLQHPHILPLYDSGDADGLLFYVMPFIEGEALSDRIAREKQLPVEEAVRIAREVASALDYAHRRGVIHRDIKPANILLQDGTALVADFGIALAVSNAGGARLTETGLSLGTPSYMSPEQATGGRQLDARSDVYSLGAVLYEMLTGDPPHTGSTAQAVIAAVVTEQPRDVTTRRPRIAPHVAEAVHRALEKLPADRFPSAAEFSRALEGPAVATGRIAAYRAPVAKPRRWLPVALGLVGVAIGLVAGRLLLAPAPRPETRTRLTFTGDARLPATTLDGKWLAYVRGQCSEGSFLGGCVGALLVQELPSGLPATLVSGAQRVAQPVWSPDGAALLVPMAPPGGEYGLYLLQRTGGVPRKVADDAVSYAFVDAATAAYLPRRGTVIRRVDLATGDSRDSIVLNGDWLLTGVDVNPRNGLLALTGFHGGAVRMAIADARGRILDTLSQMAGGGWDVDGRHAVVAVFDARSLTHLYRVQVTDAGRFSGQRVEIFAGFPQDQLTGIAGLPDGFVVGEAGRTADVWAFPLGGVARRLTHSSTWYLPPAAVSPDGRTVAYIKQDGWGTNVYAAPTDGGPERPVTTDSGLRQNAGWLPDGRRVGSILLVSGGATGSFVFEMVETGTGRRRRIPIGLFSGGTWRPDLTAVALELGGAGIAILDSTGTILRRIPVPDSLRPAAGIALAPDAREVAVGARLGPQTRFVALDVETGAWRALGALPWNDSVTAAGLVRWGTDGFVYLGRQAGSGSLELWRLPARGGAPQRLPPLPVRCEIRSLSLSADARTGACLVTDERPDLWLVERRR